MKGVAWEKKVVFESPPSPNPLIKTIRDLCLHDHALTILLGAKPDAEIIVAHQRALEQMNVVFVFQQRAVERRQDPDEGTRDNAPRSGA